MTEFKPGDKVRPKTNSGIRTDVEREVVYYGKKWVLFTHNDSENCIWREHFDRDFEKIVPFFEEGKTYTCVGDTFTVKLVVADGNGTPVAFGFIKSPNSKGMWTCKRGGVYRVWTEVTDD